jgi:hypothetical protein
MKKIFFLCLCSALSAFGQISPEKAKEILGNKFISREEAADSWAWMAHTDAAETKLMNIPYSENQLKQCALANTQGADFYLVPVFGLERSELSVFWNIRAQALPLKTSLAGWRLINFAKKQELCFSWQDEKDRAKEQGLKLLPALDYLELVATIKIVRGEDKTRSFAEFFFSTEAVDSQDEDDVAGDKVVVFAANLAQRTALLISFPQEKFLPASVKPQEISFIVLGDGQTTFCLRQIKTFVSVPPGGADYSVSTILYRYSQP